MVIQLNLYILGKSLCFDIFKSMIFIMVTVLCYATTIICGNEAA